MTLKQAILALPKIDKRWVKHAIAGNIRKHYAVFGKDKILLVYQNFFPGRNNSINKYHAAAKTIGMEIWWVPYPDGHHAYFIPTPMGRVSVGPHKTPALAIQAAFIAAVEYRLKERGIRP